MSKTARNFRFFTSVLVVDLMEDVNQVLVCCDHQLQVRDVAECVAKQSSELKCMGISDDLVNCMASQCRHDSHEVQLSTL